MINYPCLDNLTDLELILLHHKVADSKDITDIGFRNNIQMKLKERCITVVEKEEQV